MISAAATTTSSCIGPHARMIALCTGNGSIHIALDYLSILPVLILGGGGLLLLLVSAVLPKRRRRGLYPVLTFAVGAAAALTTIAQWLDIDHHGARMTIGGQVFYDHFSVLFLLLISIATMLGAAFSDSYLEREGLVGVEAYVLMLMAGSGAMLMAESGGLIMLFLGLEIMSIAMYVMAAYHRRREVSGEAGLKYFILGSFSSAIFLYGVALTYGATGSTQFHDIAFFLAHNNISQDGVLLGGMALLIVGLGFKVAAVPFHVWTPDVYQGAPTPFTGYMAAVAKAAGFAGLLRVLDQGLLSQQVNWRPAIWLLAVLTLLVGSVLAIVQRDLKRMMAYSSISQAGYVLIGLQAASSRGVSAVLFYLFTYTFIIAGTFAVLGIVQGQGEARNDLGSVRGLGRRQPLLALAMLILLLAQAGVPFTSGFLGKFYVIEAAVDVGQYPLAVIGMLAAAIAAFFYLRVALVMYSAPEEAGAPVPASSGEAGAPVTASRPAAAQGALAGAAVGAGGAGGSTAGYGGPDGSDDELSPVIDRAAFAGLEPVPSLDDPDAGSTDVLQAPPPGEIKVPLADGIALGVCVVFTIFAGVSSPVIDLARHATTLF